jgi:hypothetical protein
MIAAPARAAVSVRASAIRVKSNEVALSVFVVCVEADKAEYSRGDSDSLLQSGAALLKAGLPDGRVSPVAEIQMRASPLEERTRRRRL